MSSVAVKGPETSGAGLLDRLHVGILAGVVYILGSLAILFGLLRWLWWDKFHLERASALATVGLICTGVVVAGVLVALGLRLLGQHPVPGLKAGIFTALVTLLAIILLTRGASLWLEGWVYDSRSFTETVGVILAAAVGVVLLVAAVRFIFLAPSFGAKMVAFEEQGWFSGTSFKRSQGQRVRRGTILAILILAGCGIYSMESHSTLAGTKDWAVNVPFTGQETVTALNDAAATLGDKVPRDEEGQPTVPFTVDPGTFREANDKLKKDFVKIDEPNDADQFTKGQVVSKSTYESVRKEIGEKGKEPAFRPPEPAKGTLSYQASVTLLPDVKYTLPIVLAALAIWFAWRIVNVPSFGDFLIATEAELNKVSWTSRRRLIQDTIVVLVTVVLFTLFLFVVDVAWGKILSWDRVGVLKLPEGGAADQAKQQKW